MAQRANRLSMAQIWMFTALQLSRRSECSKLKVGCILTTSDLRHVLGNGYNGGMSGSDEICTPTTCSCLHAEDSAIGDAGSQYKDKVAFVTTFPCIPCTTRMVNSGISKLYYHKDYKVGSRHWKDHDRIVKLLSEREIEIIKI